MKHLPLAGISVLVTRASEQAVDLIEDLSVRGADVEVIPAVSVEPLPEPEGFDRAMAAAEKYDSLVFTSVNGVGFTLDLLGNRGLQPADLPPALCVGSKTALAWEDAGGRVAAVPEHFTGKSLLDAAGSDLSGRAYLVLRPERVKTDIGDALRARGALVDEVVIYRTITPGEGRKRLGEMLQSGKPDVIMFASPSAVEGILKLSVRCPESRVRRDSVTRDPELRTQSPDRGILGTPAICIGPTTAEAAEQAGFSEVYFPEVHTGEGMVEELLVISGKLK